MNKIIMSLLFIVAATTSHAQYSPKLDTVVSGAISRFSRGKPWIIASAGVWRNGHSYITPADTATARIYEIGSVTKSFFSLVLAHAILEKRVAPTDDIRKYLPGTFPNLQFRNQPIQLMHLATWTSALPNNFPEGSDLMTGLHSASLDTFPGLLPHHSNVAAQVMAVVLENIYHQPYPLLIKNYITGPLKMNRTFFEVPASQMRYLAKGYNHEGTVRPYLPESAASAGGLHCTVSDMMKYVKYQMDEPDSAVRMTHQAGWGDANTFAIAMNWFIGKTPDGRKFIKNDGTTFGFTTAVLIYPSLHFAAVLLANEQDSSSNNRLNAAAQDIFDEIYYTAAERASDAFGFSGAAHLLNKKLDEQDVSHAETIYQEMLKSDTASKLSENELNSWGYALMQKHKTDKALAIFKLNVSLFPESWNTYDSYGEILLATGQKDSAITMYRKSVQLNPNSEHGKEVLHRLQNP